MRGRPASSHDTGSGRRLPLTASGIKDCVQGLSLSANGKQAKGTFKP